MGRNTWSAYQLFFELLSPMHIGWRKVGNLQQTRTYVLSRTIWGALTARLARAAGAADDNTLYKKFGSMIDDGLRFSYFYLTDSKMQLSCLAGSGGWPWRAEEVVGGAGSSTDLFDWKYLHSYNGSPVTEQRVTQAGGLHETELIMPFTREGKKVYLTGIVFENKKNGLVISNWKRSFNYLQLGGERSYGWGKVVLAEKMMGTDKLFGSDLRLDKLHPQVLLPANSFITSHVQLNKAASVEDFAGDVEVLAGRLTTKGGKYGRNFAAPLPCWAPGTKVLTEKYFDICSQGIWEESY
ncbi:MAG TPA: CRISPR-associated protein [Firmicutes bacterium]|jgi:hypothetical protein|nr:CRISPR-associated protein [Bacillota bacterium]